MSDSTAIENSLVARIFRGGNKCGHDKNNPFPALTRASENRPDFLYAAGEAFRKYFSSPDLFPSLKHAFSSRQQRSERREAVIITMLAILEFLDLASLRVGIPTAEYGFKPLTLDVLRRRTNLHSRRFERAIQTLCRAGILKVSDQHRIRTISGQWAYFPSVRRVNRAFFDLLGLGKELIKASKEASEWLQIKAKALKTTVTEMAKIKLAATAAEFEEYAKQRQYIRKKQNEKAAREKNKLRNEIEALAATRVPDFMAKQLAQAHLDYFSKRPRPFTK